MKGISFSVKKMAKCYKFKAMLKTKFLKGGEARGNKLHPIKIWQGKLGISAGNFSLPAVTNLAS